jgi:hypothetical protein
MTSPLRSSFGCAVLSLTAFAVGGCENDSPRSTHDRGTGGAPMTASGELALPDPKPMDADGMFFDGRIEAEAMLAKSDVVWKNVSPGESGDAGPRHGGGGVSGGFGGGGGGHRGGGHGTGGGGHRQNSGEDRTSAGGTEGGPQRTSLKASNSPPVQLRLRLTNHGNTPAEIEVLDFNSELGNFVVEPKKISLAPGESTEADPMTSRLGVPALAEIPITVRMRVNGKIEQQVLELRPRNEPAAAQSGT